MKRQSSGYGQAGGRGQGQPYSRFQIEGDPTPYIPIWAAGSMVSTIPAHLMGNEGGAYYYGGTKVGGITNMMSNGEVLHSIVVDQQIVLNPNNVRLILGGNAYDEIVNTTQVAIRNYDIGASNPLLNPVVVNGEFAFRDTTTTQYGAVTEQFTVAGTVTAATGSPNIVGAGTAFTTATLPGYAYTPSFNAPRAGDLLEVIQAGVSQYYRITFITDATHLTIFPNYQNTGGAGLTYKIHRTGYGSWSRNEQLLPQANIVYYAGNSVGNGFSGGTIEAVRLDTGAHFMCPQNSASQDIKANDVAYYKSFLLYGLGGSISWSVAGFPTAVATGFGATDFPAQNVSVVALNDLFVGFEFLGDQLIAVFQNSMFLVQATGIIPEFSFYRMAEPTGAFQRPIGVDPQGTNGTFFTRQTASVRNGFVFVSQEGLQRLDGGLAHPLSKPVDTWDFPSSTFGDWILSWDASGNSVSWTNNHLGRYLIFDQERETWSQIDLSGILGRGLTGSNRQNASSSFTSYRPNTYSYWVPSGATYLLSQTTEKDNNFSSVVPWTWATPIVTLGAVYDGFRFGGFEIWCRAPALTTSNWVLQWSIYGGQDPYHMNLRAGPVTYDYAVGFQSARNKLGPTLDDPYIGFVLTGSQWIELAGIVIYPADSTAAS
jgi:hypothetical protein